MQTMMIITMSMIRQIMILKISQTLGDTGIKPESCHVRPGLDFLGDADGRPHPLSPSEPHKTLRSRGAARTRKGWCLVCSAAAFHPNPTHPGAMPTSRCSRHATQHPRTSCCAHPGDHRMRNSRIGSRARVSSARFMAVRDSAGAWRRKAGDFGSVPHATGRPRDQSTMRPRGASPRARSPGGGGGLCCAHTHAREHPDHGTVYS